MSLNIVKIRTRLGGSGLGKVRLAPCHTGREGQEKVQVICVLKILWKIEFLHFFVIFYAHFSTSYFNFVVHI